MGGALESGLVGGGGLFGGRLDSGLVGGIRVFIVN
jgi:hypothetical protein